VSGVEGEDSHRRRRGGWPQRVRPGGEAHQEDAARADARDSQAPPGTGVKEEMRMNDWLDENWSPSFPCAPRPISGI
jgi:hypothetical protein